MFLHYRNKSRKRVSGREQMGNMPKAQSSTEEEWVKGVEEDGGQLLCFEEGEAAHSKTNMTPSPQSRHNSPGD